MRGLFVFVLALGIAIPLSAQRGHSGGFGGARGGSIGGLRGGGMSGSHFGGGGGFRGGGGGTFAAAAVFFVAAAEPFGGEEFSVVDTAAGFDSSAVTDMDGAFTVAVGVGSDILACPTTGPAITASDTPTIPTTTITMAITDMVRRDILTGMDTAAVSRSLRQW